MANVSAVLGPGYVALTMDLSNSNDERMAVLAVLAAAAREAEELLAEGTEIPVWSTDEANRRLKLFMQVARQTAR